MAAHRRGHPAPLADPPPPPPTPVPASLPPQLVLLPPMVPHLFCRPVSSAAPCPLHPWLPRPGPSHPPPLLILYLCSGIPPCHRTPPPRLGLGLPPSAAHLQLASCVFLQFRQGAARQGHQHGPLPQGRQAIESSLDVILCLVQLH